MTWQQRFTGNKLQQQHGRSQKFFQGGGKVDILLSFFWLLAIQRKLTYTKKCPMLWGTVRKKLYRTDLAQKLLSLRRDSYLFAHLAISGQR